MVMKWRVIQTDSESESGVAPMCPDQRHWQSGGDPTGVYDDCCPGPHIECWFPDEALKIASHLNMVSAEVCS